MLEGLPCRPSLKPPHMRRNHRSVAQPSNELASLHRMIQMYMQCSGVPVSIFAQAQKLFAQAQKLFAQAQKLAFAVLLPSAMFLSLV